ncbi:MAG TPA: hypothetical protein VLL52_02665, partial [Anaerolineae bacterium]|nr:hypothetical protein [Anaerolineae bacterium]
VASGDGQVTIFNLEDIFADTGTLALQRLDNPPDLPSWLTPVGQSYRFLADETFPRVIAFDYLGRDVPAGYEFGLHIYYSPDEGQTWTRLNTRLDTDENRATAVMPNNVFNSQGIYTLIATVDVGPFTAGWNNFGYPIPETREVTQSLASITNSYSVVYHYGSASSWSVYDPAVNKEYPALAGLVNDLDTFEFAQGYWISVTELVTLHLGVPASSVGALNGGANPQLPPATFFGWVTPTATFTPTAGSVVTARVDGNVCGSGTVVAWNGRLAYRLDVLAENLWGTANGCGTLGKVVVFEVDGVVLAADRPWANDQAWYHPLTDSSCGAPEAVTAVTKGISGNDLDLSWSAVSGATGYEVWRLADDPYGVPVVACGSVSYCSEVVGPSYTDVGGVGDVSQNYTYWVVAVNGCGGRTAPAVRAAEFDFGIVGGQ